VPLLAGVHLHDARTELGSEWGALWQPMRARGHDDGGGPGPAAACRHPEPVPLPGKLVDDGARAYGEIESIRVRLQVIAHLVLGRVGPARRREPPAGESVVARR